MYFNFGLNFNILLSSADNSFEQFGSRSGQTFCRDLIGVQTVWHFRGYDMLKLNQCIKLALNLYLTLSSADNPFKQFGPRSSPTFCPDLIGVQTVWHFRGYNIQVEVEPINFNFALNLNMTLSSANNPFKQFGPRSGPTFCPDVIVVQTVWRFRVYDKLKMNQCILNLR